MGGDCGEKDIFQAKETAWIKGIETGKQCCMIENRLEVFVDITGNGSLAFY